MDRVYGTLVSLICISLLMLVLNILEMVKYNIPWISDMFGAFGIAINIAQIALLTFSIYSYYTNKTKPNQVKTEE